MGRVIRPQRGPQERFLSTSADIAVYGGAAGGGKTYALLMEPLRYINVKGYNAVIFRQSYAQITVAGGLWDESMKMYNGIKGAIPLKTPKFHWSFGGCSTLYFDYLGKNQDVYKWQGSQITFIGFDELCHFSQQMFFYMLSRNRSACGVRPYVRATCNPDADSWVAKFIQWYWDAKTGYPIPERSGVLRYFVRIGDEIYWGNTKKEILAKHPTVNPEWIKSFTFISSKLSDNKILMQSDPGYLGNLMAQSEVERERLLYGNWKIKPSAGKYFKSEHFTIVDSLPKVTAWVRSWDLAATEPTEANPNPDATAGVLIGRTKEGQYIVADVKRVQVNSNSVRRLVLNSATLDRMRFNNVHITVPQDPGQAGKEQAESYVSMLAGFSVKSVKPNGSKQNRAEPFASQVQAGNVMLLKADWNESFITELESFPDALHDDMVDAASDAFNELSKTKSWAGLVV